MESIIWYILVVNGLVLLGQVAISVIFFYFSHKTSRTIEAAIKDVNKQLEDKKMLNEITKKLDAKFGNRMSKFSKKVSLLQKEAGIEDGGFLGMVMDAMNNDEGIIDYAVRNKGQVMHVVKGLSKKDEPKEVDEEVEYKKIEELGEYADSLMTDEQKDLIEKKRRELVGEGAE